MIKTTNAQYPLMIKKHYLLFCILYIPGLLFAQTKTIYFDSGWKETTKSSAVFYRPLPLLKSGTLELLRDYYVKGDVMQMQGYFAGGNKKNWVGTRFSYEYNGQDKYETLYINTTKQKKLTYYFDDGEIWKTIEYGDSLKSGKTIEYKPDGSILGEAIYKDGYLDSGIVGYHNNHGDYQRYNAETGSDEFVTTPVRKTSKAYKEIYYWKKTLKTAVEYSYRNDRLILEKHFDENGNLIQQTDSTSYFYPEKELKEGKYFYYSTQKSSVSKAPEYIEYKSFPFSEVNMENVSYIVLYRGTINFLEKHPADDLYREIRYHFFNDNGTDFVRLQRDYTFGGWKPIERFKDGEMQFIPVSDLEALSKERVFRKFSKRKWTNVYLKNKPVSEQLYFSSPDCMGKTRRYSSSGKTETNEQESKLIYLNLAPGKYIILRQNGGYFIPKSSGDIIEIPNYVQE
ncbi:toxin-antitoxin system YwqK family antitoxin [Chryseobacterium jejuense]|uniref:Antitoxin component YwqK of the YwqJK toxin-antitoxin module n=1 Tax=Chryseobacterium jejuense TaxID=445960 RepID=A0A2X2VR25_CHRJE|nr:hypothetical protein [Chryseobacterium jejuense]SDJ16216.1 Antitoxin component YwqK of the YwqJK toxin-antitoxin module [Chryseobacterium jejuense]SQB28091.1 Uncharacterised protein [Chryseobacterium jejuense]